LTCSGMKKQCKWWLLAGLCGLCLVQPPLHASQAVPSPAPAGEGDFGTYLSSLQEKAHNGDKAAARELAVHYDVEGNAPETSKWMSEYVSLAEKEAITPQDLWDKPLLLSHQRGGSGALFRWLKRDASQLNVVATYNLVYNASLLVDEGLGYALTLDKLIHTEGTDMCFRPLSPGMEATAAIVWKKYQVFTKAADTFLRCLKEQLPQES
jgi:hypothetical protein